MNLDQLKYFNAVAETSSMTAAADALYVSQSALSLAIQSLERELGFYLFIRTNHGVELTAFGQSIYEETQKIDSVLADIQQKVLQENKKITIKIATIPSAAYSLLFSILQPFHAVYPDVKVQIEENPMPANLVNVSINDYSFIITTASQQDNALDHISGVSKRKKLTAQRLYNDQLLLFCSTAHPLAKQNSVALTDLKRYPIILTPKILEIIPDDFHDNVTVLIDREAIKRYLSASQEYISLLPGILAYEDIYIDSGCLITRPLAWTVPEISNYVYYDKSKPLSQPERFYLQLLQETGAQLNEQLAALHTFS